MEGKEGADPWIARKFLMPIPRGLCANWATGNRREAGMALAHITNSGSEASAIVAAMSKTLKKVRKACPMVLYVPLISKRCLKRLAIAQINPVRLLEAHMACLREEFEAWADNEPVEPETENPTDEENAAFEEAEKQHEEAVRITYLVGRNFIIS